MTEKEFLNIKVDLPTFQLEVRSQEPTTALAEIRRILDSLNIDEAVIYEEFVTEELKAVFSEHFVKNTEVMTAIKHLLKKEDDYRIASIEIPSKALIDLDNGTKSVQVEKRDVKRSIIQLTNHLDSNLVKQGIIHVNGVVDEDARLMIIDHVHTLMPTAQLRAFQSSTKDANVTVECIFFGEFPEED